MFSTETYDPLTSILAPPPQDYASAETAVPVSDINSIDYGLIPAPPDPYGVLFPGSNITSYADRASSRYDNNVRDATELPSAYATQSQTANQRLGWFDVHPQNWGWNSASLRAGAGILNTFSTLSQTKSQYKQQAANYGMQASYLDRQAEHLDMSADYLRTQASTNYRIAAMNIARMRTGQESYLGSQIVSAVSSGVSLDSGSVRAVRQTTMSEFQRELNDAADSAEQQRQTNTYQADVANWQADSARVQSRNLLRQQQAARKQASALRFGQLLSFGGAIGGTLLGGPVGAAIGAQAGGAAGTAIGEYLI